MKKQSIKTNHYSVLEEFILFVWFVYTGYLTYGHFHTEPGEGLTVLALFFAFWIPFTVFVVVIFFGAPLWRKHRARRSDVSRGNKKQTYGLPALVAGVFVALLGFTGDEDFAVITLLSSVAFLIAVGAGFVSLIKDEKRTKLFAVVGIVLAVAVALLAYWNVYNGLLLILL